MKQLIATSVVLLLAACSSGSPPPAPGAPRAAKSDVAMLVASVRAAGAQGNELDVQPLRDPQVEDLRAQAHALEADGKWANAGAALDQALAISPGDPELLQWQAELALMRRDWAQAEALAEESFRNGPQLGGLCRRNWMTIQHARAHRGDVANAESARLRVDGCTVAPPVRM